MRQLPKLYLLLSSLLFLVIVSCRISKYKHKDCEKAVLTEELLSPIINSHHPLKYKTTIGRLAGDEALVKDGAVALVAAALQTALALAGRPGVFVGGTAHVARHPEFREAQSLRPVLDLIDRSEPWRDLVHGEEPGLAVTIGREHGRPEWAHLSLVSFRLPGPGDASIGLLGPRRMDYARVMGLVDYVGRRLPSYF